MKKSATAALALALLLLGSCTQRLTDFTVISTKNVPINKGAVELRTGDQRVKGIDKAHYVVCIPTGFPNMKEAIDKAIEQTPGAIGLTDGVVKSKFWHALVYGQTAYIVEGTPLFEVTEGQKADISVPAAASDTGALLFYHDVKQGETLASIAAAYGIGIADIVKWNKLSSSEVAAGTKLTIRLNQ